MTQYKSIKVSTEDYDTLKRYMHLSFLDSMSEAFHSAISTALFEEFGEGIPKPSRSQAVISDLTVRAQVNAEERDQALSLLHMTVPELHQEIQKKELHNEMSLDGSGDVDFSKLQPVEPVEPVEVKENVPHAKRHYNRKKKVPK